MHFIIKDYKMKKINHFLVLIYIAGFSTNVSSQINYQDFVPDIVMGTWDSKDINIDSSVNAVLAYGKAGNLTVWEEFGTRIVVNAFTDCEVLWYGSFPAALDLGQPIDSTGQWYIPDYDILNDGSQGNWIGEVDKYLGVRVSSGAQWLYGWIRMDVNHAGTTVIIKDYACNRTIDEVIYAGQITPTGIHQQSNESENLFFIYPNPNNGSFILEIEEMSQPFQVLILNSYGQIVYRKSDIRSSSIDVELGNVSRGLFTVKIISEEKVYDKKLLIK